MGGEVYASSSKLSVQLSIYFLSKVKRSLDREVRIPRSFLAMAFRDTKGYSDQIRSVAQSCLTLCDPMNRSTPGLPVHHQLSSLRLTSIESVMPSSHLILCCPLLLLPPIPPSIRVFSNETTLHMRWPEYWSFSFSIIPSKEIPGLISFRMDW